MKTTHKENCKRVFKNYDPTCTRCQELATGAKPRAGWNDLKQHQDSMRSRHINEHFVNHEQTCEYAKNGLPCVKFDW